MFGLIKKGFIVVLPSIVNASNLTKCVSLSNQKRKIQCTLNLDPNEYSQEFHYSFSVKLDRCVGSCNTLNDLSNKVCIPNKRSVFNMITGINELKALTKHISCECKCKFDGTKCGIMINVDDKWQINGVIMINVDVSVKKHYICKNDYVWNSATCNCENWKYLASTMDNSVIICDEVIKS